MRCRLGMPKQALCLSGPVCQKGMRALRRVGGRDALPPQKDGPRDAPVTILVGPRREGVSPSHAPQGAHVPGVPPLLRWRGGVHWRSPSLSAGGAMRKRTSPGRERSASAQERAGQFALSKLAVAVAAASGLGSAPALHAQETEAQAPALEEVIVTARKRESNIQDTPVSIQAFTSDDLERMDLDRFEDFADQSPSLSYISAGPGTQLIAHSRRFRRRHPACVPHQRRDHQLLSRRTAGERPRWRRTGFAPLRHRAHRSAARAGRHLLRCKLRLRARCASSPTSPTRKRRPTASTLPAVPSPTATPPTRQKASATCRSRTAPPCAPCSGTTSPMASWTTSPPTSPTPTASPSATAAGPARTTTKRKPPAAAFPCAST